MFWSNLEDLEMYVSLTEVDLLSTLDAGDEACKQGDPSWL